MKVYSKSILSNGYLDEKFGNNSKNKNDFINGTNVRSFHIGWSELNKNTKCIVILFLDYDSIPVCGFPFIHWSVINIDPNLNELVENASVLFKDKLIQGTNSLYSPFFNPNKKPNYEIETTLYVGCAPPDKDHIYSCKIYSMSKFLDLKNGFFVNDLYHQLKGNVLDKKTLVFKYKKVSY